MVKILIPLAENNGRESLPSESLGAAPYYLITDTENTIEDKIIENTSKAEGLPPIKFVIKQPVDLIFTMEACKNALAHINRANMTPYHVSNESVNTILERYKNGELSKLLEATH